MAYHYKRFIVADWETGEIIKTFEYDQDRRDWTLKNCNRDLDGKWLYNGKRIEWYED